MVGEEMRRMDLAHITQLKAAQVQEELAEGCREAEETRASAELVERIKLLTATLAFWLQPPGDDFQVRAAISEAEVILREWENHRAQRRVTATVPPGVKLRTHTRVPTSGVTVRVQVTEGAKLEQFYVRDISQGGMFLRATQILPPYSHLLLVLVMPDAREIKIGCRVVHVVPPERASAENPSGMGVAFIDLTDEVRSQIATYVGLLKEQSKNTKPDASAQVFQMPTVEFPEAQSTPSTEQESLENSPTTDPPKQT
jgi:Tfp pilus assembly protein PilZ